MPEYRPLSPRAAALWGKTDRGWNRRPPKVLRAHPLARHLAETCETALLLWDRWLPRSLRAHIAAALPDGEADGRTLLGWLAGIHDIGKATPAFTCCVPELAAKVRAAGLGWSPEAEHDRRKAPHATAGQYITERWLAERFGWNVRHARQFAAPVGGHHGAPPTRAALAELRERVYLLGWEGADAGAWRGTQYELLDRMAARTGAAQRIPDWTGVRLPQSAQVLLTALVIIADWIASDAERFPYDGDDDAYGRAARAYEGLGLPVPWTAPPVTADVPALMHARFTLPEGAEPYPVQIATVEAAQRMPEPGLLIVEAPMGDGKTEAALAAAEVMAARFGLGGCFCALPTRATSDGVFTRFLKWVERLPDEEAAGRHVAVAHGKALMNDEYARLLDVAAVGEPGEAQLVAAHLWLTGRHKAMLAPFTVGTIDQLLMMALQMKHVVLRHLGLAGKVVVIDEAHAYDVYMSRYLDRALTWLGAYGVPVVVLSATLPGRRRAELVRAYDGDRVGEGAYDGLAGEKRYPLVTRSRAGEPPEAVGTEHSSRANSVHIGRIGDSADALVAVLREKLVDGGCVLVVRNTVKRVLATADALRKRLPESLGAEVRVAHSRYIAPDRAGNDQWLRDTFGPPAKDRVRPQCTIVVASQVAEQSLDVDFDLLITDLAPVDLLLQRMGRLHRHERERPALLRRPTCLITGASWAGWPEAPPQPDAGSAYVYQEYPLLRAAAVLHDHGREPIRLPGDIARLVQDAYGDEPLGPLTWKTSMEEVRELFQRHLTDKAAKADVFRLPEPGPDGRAPERFTAVLDENQAAGGATATAQVRDGLDSLEVVLLVEKDGELYTPGWLREGGGLHVPVDRVPAQDVAKAAAACTIALPREVDTEQAIAELSGRRDYKAWRGGGYASHWLSGAVVLTVDEHGEGGVAGMRLHYDRRDGLRLGKGRS